jgi:uncharacterized surface protein with fasciclin (FAS1) repeats
VSDRPGPDDGRDPEPTEYFPPPIPAERVEPAEPTGTELPPIGTERDPEPTRVMPPSEPGAGPTEAMPPVGGPYDPGPPYGGAGGPGGGGGGDDGDYGLEPEPEPWWRQRGPLAALIAGIAALVVGLIALFVWTGDGDDGDSDDTLPALPTSSTVAPATTGAATTAPDTTTTSTTAPTTTTTTTTLPPTTTTTTAPPTTTTTTTTLPPTTTTTIPVVTVPPQPAATTWDVIVNSPDLSEMRNAVETAGLVDLLDDGDQGITVLAPSNAAFEAMRATQSGADLLDDPERLAALLRRHVVVEPLSAGEFPGRGQLQTAADADDCALLGAAEGCDVLTTGGDDESPPTVEGASFLVTDVEAANGLLDVIDRVLLP